MMRLGNEGDSLYQLSLDGLSGVITDKGRGMNDNG